MVLNKMFCTKHNHKLSTWIESDTIIQFLVEILTEKKWNFTLANLLVLCRKMGKFSLFIGVLTTLLYNDTMASQVWKCFDIGRATAITIDSSALCIEELIQSEGGKEGGGKETQMHSDGRNQSKNVTVAIKAKSAGCSPLHKQRAFIFHF